jgi:hypothetical protein
MVSISMFLLKIGSLYLGFLVTAEAKSSCFAAVARHYLPNSFKDIPVALELSNEVRDILPTHISPAIIKDTRNFHDLKSQMEK